MDFQGKIINCLGDSITEAWGASSMEYGYVNQLKERLGLKEARNYGIGGTRIAHQREMAPDDHSDQNYCFRMAGMDPDADAVIVFGGTNDFGHGTAPFGTMDDRTPDTFYGACHYLFSHLITAYVGKPVFVVTPTHRLDEENRINPDGVHPFFHCRPLLDYVNAIRQVAEYYSLPVIDLWRISGIQPAVPAIKERFMPDGLHPSDAGAALIADRMAAFLRAY